MRSVWEKSTSGPDRRMYELTRKGMEELHDVRQGAARDRRDPRRLPEPLLGVRRAGPESAHARGETDAARADDAGRRRGHAARRRRQGRVGQVRRRRQPRARCSRAAGTACSRWTPTRCPGCRSASAPTCPTTSPLNAAAERNENGRWHLVKGVGAARAVQRYATDAPDGVRLLQIGKTDRRGLAPNRASHNAFYQVVHRLDDVPSLQDWIILGDLPAGARQTAFDWAPYARHYLRRRRADLAGHARRRGGSSGSRASSARTPGSR